MSYGDTREASEAATLLGAALLSWSCGGYGEAMACSLSGMELDRVASGFDVDGHLVVVIPHLLNAESLVVFGHLWSAGDPAGRRNGDPAGGRDGQCELVGSHPALDGRHGSITVRPPLLESPHDYQRLAAGLREWLLEISYDARRVDPDAPGQAT